MRVLGRFVPSLPVTGGEPKDSRGKLTAPRSVEVILPTERMHVKQKLLQRIVCTTPLPTHIPPPSMAGSSIEAAAGLWPIGTKAV